MAVPFLTPIDLNHNEILNVSLQKLATDPTINLVEGRIFYHTGEQRIKYYDGNNWVPLTNNFVGNEPIQITDNGNGTVTISIDEAVASDDGIGGNRGTLSATDKEKLDDATADNVSNTLVERDADGRIRISDPATDDDAATKGYVDATAQGLDIKGSVRLATTDADGNIDLTTGGTTVMIGGLSVEVGDRVLVKNQTDATENGIFVVQSGSWIRSEDANDNQSISPGMFTFVEEGSLENTGWVLSTDSPIDVGTTGLEFTQFSGAGLITAGDGLVKEGNVIDVVGTANRIIVNDDSIDIASTYEGQTSIVTVGTITTGTWQGEIIDVLYGGTGADNATDARANLDTPGRYSETIGDGAANAYVINHGLNTADVQVFTRYLTGDNAQVFMDVEVDDANNVTVRSSNSVPLDSIRVTVIG